MKKQKKQSKIKHRVVEGLALPRDLMLGESVLQVYGQSEVYIENYRGIMEYSAEKMRIKIKDGCIEIEGRHLSIGYYSCEEMKVCGCILKISYCA